MPNRKPNKDEILDEIKRIAQKLGRRPTRREFIRESGISLNQVMKYWENWNEAVTAAGFEPDESHIKITNERLLEDWGRLVRTLRRIPTLLHYRRYGEYSDSVFTRNLGPWSSIPEIFKEFAIEKPEWSDVLTLLPITGISVNFNSKNTKEVNSGSGKAQDKKSSIKHNKISNRPVYGNPIDFRGLRHEPVNENGVIFLFGMVARELGYYVEAVQISFPDCEAKRQINAKTWQRVRIEFEFESRNFIDHGHNHEECDVIVCWRNNWPECPGNIEIVELSQVINQLGSSEE